MAPRTLDDIRTQLTPEQALTLTLWAEARGEGDQGMTAVGCVIRNRAAQPGWWGKSIKQVCLLPSQFSCWNPGTDVNHRKLLRMADRVLDGEDIADKRFQEIQVLASGIVHQLVADTTKGSDHYYSPEAMVPVGRIPKWAMDRRTNRPLAPTIIIGRQRFYKLGLSA